MDGMDLRERFLGFLPLPIQDPANAAEFLSAEKAMALVDIGMERHEQRTAVITCSGRAK
jgi:hypothetical protein